MSQTPIIELDIVFKATDRLKAILKLKSSILKLKKSNPMYQINCLWMLGIFTMA